MSLSRSADGTLFGATFVDHESMRAYKLSELDRSFHKDEQEKVITPILKAAAVPETGSWAENEKLYYEQWLESKRTEHKKRLALKREAHIQHNMDLAAKQASDQQKDPIQAYRRILKRKPLPGEFDYLVNALRTLAAILMQLETKTQGKTTRPSGIPFPPTKK